MQAHSLLCHTAHALTPHQPLRCRPLWRTLQHALPHKQAGSGSTRSTCTHIEGSCAPPLTEVLATSSPHAVNAWTLISKP